MQRVCGEGGAAYPGRSLWVSWDACPASWMLFVGWEATAAAARSSLTMEKSAEVVVPAGIVVVAGTGRTRAERADARGRGRGDDRSQPCEGPGRDGLRLKPEDRPSERSHDPAPGETVAHPAEAGLWEQLLSRSNLAEALRRVEQNAGAAGIDGMSTKELRPWLHDRWPKIRSRLDAGTYRPQPVRRVMIPKPSGGMGSWGCRLRWIG
jgi:hypothetical protein